jgi:hypothetical protein
MIYLGQIYLAHYADGYARPGAAAPNLVLYTGFSENCRSGISYPPTSSCRTQSARHVRIPRHPSPSYPQGVLREGDGVNGLHSVRVSSQYPVQKKSLKVRKDPATVEESSLFTTET